MALLALERLGANSDLLECYFNRYEAKLVKIVDNDSTEEIENIKRYLGVSEQYQNYLRYFGTQINLLGYEAVLERTLPILISGVAASAFHGLIRLAYAIEASNIDEIAISLAFWAAEYQRYELREHSTTKTCEDILLELAPLGANYTFSPGIIVDKMNEIGTLLEQKDCFYVPNNATFSDLKLLCLNAFSLKDDFTLLHTVTSCHAFSYVMHLSMMKRKLSENYGKRF